MVKNLVLLGLPGAGKGTQAAFITEDYQLVHISTGDIFRANLSENTVLGQQAREYMDAGNLVPDEITNAMVADRLNQSDVADGFMLDGYPRNHEQAVFLDKYLSDKGQAITGTLYFEVADATLRDRLLSRGRADDTPEVIANRLAINKAANMPLVDYYREAGVLHAIDGSRDVADVYADVKQALDQLS